jgi:uncharacterized protein YecE (DUF72 family)
MLDFYQQRFDTVEVNNSFYGLPSTATLATWREATHPDFCFAVKASRFITHLKRLRDTKEGLQRLLERVAELGPKLGPILFQLPPHWSCDLLRLRDFLDVLPHGRRYVFELRDASWHNAEVYTLLREHNAGFCIYELAGVRSPLEVTADFAYVRLHGPETAAYTGSYSPEALTTWADRLRAWQRELRAAYVYFDNDQAGFAAQNALELRRLVQDQ